jgi:glycerol uptake facilitator-like aquaporin
MSQRLVAEGLGTALLLFVIVGSGIAAETLSSDAGVQLMAHAISVGLGLAVLIALFQPVSGSHFNPAVTLASWRTGDMASGEAASYVAAQLAGAVIGVVAADFTFGRPVLSVSSTARSEVGLVGAEVVATFVLVLVILGLVRTGRSGAVPSAVGAWVAAAIFATSSTSFANPAVTIARVFTDSYTGIDPSSVAGFLVAHMVAALLAAILAPYLHPVPAAT